MAKLIGVLGVLVLVLMVPIMLVAGAMGTRATSGNSGSSSPYIEQLVAMGYENGRLPPEAMTVVSTHGRYECQVAKVGFADQAWMALVVAAELDGVDIEGGWCYRTLESQVAAWNRRQCYIPGNCDGDPHPPTARPGTSRHGWGLAIDVWGATDDILRVLRARAPLAPDQRPSVRVGQSRMGALRSRRCRTVALGIRGQRTHPPDRTKRAVARKQKGRNEMRLITILAQVTVPDPSVPPELGGDTWPDPCVGTLRHPVVRWPDGAGVRACVGVLGEHREPPERVTREERHPDRSDRVLHWSVYQHDPLDRSSDLTWADGVHRATGSATSSPISRRAAITWILETTVAMIVVVITWILDSPDGALSAPALQGMIAQGIAVGRYVLPLMLLLGLIQVGVQGRPGAVARLAFIEMPVLAVAMGCGRPRHRSSSRGVRCPHGVGDRRSRNHRDAVGIRHPAIGSVPRGCTALPARGWCALPYCSHWCNARVGDDADA